MPFVIDTDLVIVSHFYEMIHATLQEVFDNRENGRSGRGGGNNKMEVQFCIETWIIPILNKKENGWSISLII